MSKKTYTGEINKNTEWCGDSSTRGLPVCGQSIEDFLKKTINGKFGEIYYDEPTVKYLLFADEEDRELYLSDRIAYADLLLGRFEAPEPYTITAVFDRENVYTLKGSENTTIDFTFKTVDSSKDELKESVQVTYTFNNAGNIQTLTKIYSPGEKVSLIIDDFLSIGNNMITVSLLGRSSGASKIYTVYYTVVQLDLTCDLNICTPIPEGDQIPISYHISGLGNKFIEFYIDGEETASATDTVNDAEKLKTYYLANNLTAGKHSLQISAYITLDQTRFCSKTIYKEFVVTKPEVSQSHATIELEFAPGELITAERGLKITAEQYKTISIPWGYYSSDGRDAQVTWVLGEESLGSITAQNGTSSPYQLSFVPQKLGNLTLTAWVEDKMIAEFPVYVGENSEGVMEITDSLIFKLSALGRSNEEPAETGHKWENNGITTTFSEGFAWSAQQGWDNNALVLSGGATAVINYQPLLGDVTTSGFTFEVEFETFNVDDPDAKIIDVYDTNSKAGIEITATKGIISTLGGTRSLTTRFKDSERIKLAFIINRKSGVEEAGLIYIQNNGILERGTPYATDDSFRCEDKIVLGDPSGKSSVRIYSIRCYSKALSTDEEFYNYIIDSGNISKKIQENDIYIEGQKKVSVEKMQSKLPVMLFTGPIGSVLMASSSKSVEIYADVDYTNPQDPTKNFTCTHARMKLQGTSSLTYPRKNFKLYTRSKYGAEMRDYEGKVLYNGLYSFKDGSVPVYTWTLKADFSDSSCTHNSTIARLFGDIEPNVQVGGKYVLRTPPQEYVRNLYEKETGAKFPYDMRTTPDSLPMVCFYRETEEDEYIFLGQYNFLNDKGNEYVYGFRSIYNNPEDPFYLYSTKDKTKILWDNVNVHCYEILDNSNLFSTFSTTEGWNDIIEDQDGTKTLAWEKAFESRYPEVEETDPLEDHIAAGKPLKAFIEWILEYKDKPKEEFEAHMEDHLDLYMLAAYYVYLMRFGAVDQVQKNMMWTTYDGDHWFPIRYDNDTILGLRNDLRLVFDYKIDRQTIDPTTNNSYCFAGHDSWLWNSLEGSNKFIKEIVPAVDQALYTAGLSYNTACNYFDVTTSDKWCERIYNDNGRFKYVEPYIQSNRSDSNSLVALQGKRQSHRHWWLKNRFNIYDAKFLSGEYTNKKIIWRGDTLRSEGGQKLYFKVAQDSYYGWGYKDPQETGIEKKAGDDWTLQINKKLAVGDPVHIYGAINIEEANFSELMPYSSYVDLKDAYDEEIGSSLKKLNVGCDLTQELRNPNPDFKLDGLALHTRLEYLNIQGLTKLASVDISTLPNLKYFLAAESGLATITPVEGCNFDELELPETLQVMNFNKITWKTLTYEYSDNLNTLVMNGMGKDEKARNFIFGWMSYLLSKEGNVQWKNKSLTVTDINWENVTTEELIRLKNFAKISLRGTIKVSDMTRENFEKIKEAYGEDVFSLKNNLVIDSMTPVIFLDGPEVVTGGLSYQYTNTTFPLQYAGDTVYYLYTKNAVGNWEFDEERIKVTDDEEALKYISYLNATLWVNSGKLDTEELSADTVFGIVAYNKNLSEQYQYSELLEVNLPAIIRPKYFVVSEGDQQINPEIGIILNKKGEKSEFKVAVSPTSYNVSFTKIKISLKTPSVYFSLLGASNLLEDGFKIETIQIPGSTEESKNTIIIEGTTEKDDNIRTEIPIEIEAINPERIKITGEGYITQLGTYRYAFQLLPENYNVDLKNPPSLSVDNNGIGIVSVKSIEWGMNNGHTDGGYIDLLVSKIPQGTRDLSYGLNFETIWNNEITEGKNLDIKIETVPPEGFKVKNGELDLSTIGKHIIDFEVSPNYYNVPIESYSYRLSEEGNSCLEIVEEETTDTHLVLNVTNIPEVEESIALTIIGQTEYARFSTDFQIRVRVLISDFEIKGPSVFRVPDGNSTGKLQIPYTFVYSPENYNVSLKEAPIVSVDNTDHIYSIEEISSNGFKIRPRVEEREGEQNATLTATIDVEGNIITRKLNINFAYAANTVSIISIHQDADHKAPLPENEFGYEPMISPDESDIKGGAVMYIRNNSHRYIGRFDKETDTMYICQLSDENSLYFDQTNIEAPITQVPYDVWMKLPKFWYKSCRSIENCEEDENGEIINNSNISNPGPDDFDLMFCDNELEVDDSWNEWSGDFLIGAYKALKHAEGIKDSKDYELYSLSGISNDSSRTVDVTGYTSYPLPRLYSRNRGSGFSALRWKAYNILQALFLAYYGTLDSQSTIGFAFMTTSPRTGESNSLGMIDSVPRSNQICSNFWGVENFLCAGYEILDDMVISVSGSDVTWIPIDEVIDADLNNGSYWGKGNSMMDKASRTKLVTGSSNFISKIDFGSMCEFRPMELNGASNTFYRGTFLRDNSTEIPFRLGAYLSQAGSTARSYENISSMQAANSVSLKHQNAEGGYNYHKTRLCWEKKENNHLVELTYEEFAEKFYKEGTWV